MAHPAPRHGAAASDPAHRSRASGAARRILLTALSTVLLAVGCSSGTAELAGYTRDPRPVVGAASLPDASNGGTPFAFQAAPGGLLVVYFGYTSCPDVCPTTMAEIRTGLEDLGSDADRVEMAMITVDPGRDTGDVLTNYVRAFIPAGHALRTEDGAALRAAADAFGATYQVTENVDGTVEVAHTAHVYVADDAGRLRVTWPFGTPGADMANDLRILLGEG
ncbi:MAG: SCO family protein [Acidimicrobiia bacterium]|jgi:protein SCO1/2